MKIKYNDIKKDDISRESARNEICMLIDGAMTLCDSLDVAIKLVSNTINRKIQAHDYCLRQHYYESDYYKDLLNMGFQYAMIRELPDIKNFYKQKQERDEK